MLCLTCAVFRSLTRSRLSTASVAVLFAVAAAGPALAQLAPPVRVAAPAIVVNGGNPTGGSSTVALPEDRTVVRKLKLAKEQIGAKNYGDAVSVLGKLLETSEDYFFKPDADSKSHYSLRKEVERLIGTLPDEGRRHYDLRFGPPAQKMFAEALGAGNWHALEDVTRRYFHTESGYQAAWLVADYYLDQGQPLVAAKTFERLQQAPPKALAALEPALSIKLAACWLLAQREDRAKAVLKQLEITRPSASFQAASGEIELFAPGGDALARLRKHLPELLQRAATSAEHLLARGDAARSGGGASHIPQVQHVWAADHYHGGKADPQSGHSVFGNDNETDVVKTIQTYATQMRQQNQVPLPVGQPLVVGDLVLMRTATQLVAVDCRADRQGTRRWPVARDEDLLKLMTEAANEPATPNPAVMGGRVMRSPYPQPNNNAHQRDLTLQQRALQDATYSTLSSDGERVFCIEDTGVAMTPYSPYMGGLPYAQQPTVGGTNRLTAYSIFKPEAKLMWELGGKKPQTGAPGLPLAGAFFLGPPLPLAGQLYVLAETNKQIALHAIEQEFGVSAAGKTEIKARPLWAQPLCNVELGVESDPYRRTAGLSPAHSDGILICPTAAGAVVAVDLATRSLLWAYTYGRDGGASPYGGGMMVMPDGRVMPQGQGQGWADTGVMIAEGKVLATERGSQALHCIDLEKGLLTWKMDRHDALFVGGVHDGHVLVVCPTYVRAHKMTDGAPAWPDHPMQTLPNGAKVAGRGFHHSGVYVLPLDNGRLATIEIKTGDIKVTDKVVPEGRSGLGNLVCVNGWLISQDIVGVQGFRQLSLETLSEQLKKNPADAQVLTQLGELLRQKGDLDGALTHLRRAAEVSKNIVSRRLVARALVQGLQSDFSKYRQFAGELDQLTAATEASDLRAQYLRTYSDGLLSARDYKGAFETFLKLAQGDPRGLPLMASSDSLALRNDRWVQSRWAKLMESASPETRDEMAKAVADRFAAAAKDAAPDALRLALGYFGNHASAEASQERLAEMLLGQVDKSRLEAELLLRGLERSADRGRSAAAIARLADFYRTSAEWPKQSHGFPAARHYYDLLRGDLASTAGPAGKTGKQLFDEALAGDKNFADFLQPKTWPTGKIVVKTGSGSTATDPSTPAMPIRRTPYGATAQGDIDTTLLADPLAGQLRYQVRGNSFIALNTAGKGLWRVPLAVDRSAFQTVPYGHRLAAHGHLLALMTGYEIIGIDASPGADDAKRILWRHSLTKLGESDAGVGLTPSPAPEPTPWGQMVVRFNSPQGSLGSLQPLVSARQVSFLRGTELVAVDALTGDVLWKRGGMPQGADLLGDEQHLLVIGPEESKGTLYRSLDGELLGTRTAPHRTQRMAAFGCRVLTWTPESDEKAVLKMVDLLSEKTLWATDFHPTAKAAFAGPDEIGVFDARGGGERDRRSFQVLSLADGKLRFASPISDNSLDNAAAIYLQRSADRYVLAVTTAPQGGVARRAVGGWTVMANGNFQGTAHILGKVFVLDRASGKLVGDLSAPGIGLPLYQPADSPMLAFVTTAYGVRTVGGAGGPGLTRVANYQTVVQFLDKRTGRVVYREAFTPQPVQIGGEVSLTVGPGHKLEFQHQNINLQLTFTEEPLDEKEKEKRESLDLTLGLAASGAGSNLNDILVPRPVPVRVLPAVPKGVPVPVPVPVEPVPDLPLPKR